MTYACRSALISALALIATPLLAACPTQSDMQKGVIFRTAEGDTELHRKIDTNWVRIRSNFADGDISQLDYYHGLYLLSDTPIENGKPQPSKAETFGTKANIRQWPAPAPSARWRNTTPDGGSAKSRRLKTTKVGNCTFNAFEVTITFDADNYEEVYEYLPDLGTALLIASDDGETKERYSYTAVGILP